MLQTKEFIRECLRLNISDEKSLSRLKNEFSTKYATANFKNLDLVAAYRQLVEDEEIEENLPLMKLIQKRKIRSESGIAVVTVLTKPYSCPGKCIYCPGEKGMPKSYLSKEPGAQRAALSKFDPYKQVHNRLRALMIQGHPLDKIEFIVLGGTFSAYPHRYQKSFIGAVYNALNQFPEVSKQIKLSDFQGYKYAKFVGAKLKNLPKRDPFEIAKKKNETAEVRMIGLTLETRPDYVNPAELKRLRSYGCTRVEIGVQSVFNDVLLANARGHTIEDVKQATRLIKDCGLKLTYHMMPGLFKSTIDKDIEMFKVLFEDTDLNPDQIKLYPCVVTPFSPLERMWKRGLFTPLTTDEVLHIIMETAGIFPPFVRISRLIRDIPGEQITAGNFVTNLRQIAEDGMEARGVKCRCLRCREIRSLDYKPGEIKLVERSYEASGGVEHFLSFEDTKQDKVLAFARLRIPSQIFRKEPHWYGVLEGCALVRELHTYGDHTQIKTKKHNTAQHKGFGRLLMERAEEIVSKTYGLHKIAVIAGVGVREYYANKLGYKLEEEYMVKRITA